MTAKTFEEYNDNGCSGIEGNAMPTVKHCYQYLVAFSASLVLLSGGTTFGWPSPTLPILLGENSPIPITPDESSWIAVAKSVGTIASPFPAAFLMDKYGRKNAIIFSAFPLIISWILIGLGENILMLYISRVLSGLGYGMAYAITPMYLGEIASDKIRGSITVILTVMAKTGILFTFSIAPYVSMYTMAWIGIAPPLVFLAMFVWAPESPYFLLGKNRNDDAFNALARLRGHDSVGDELKRMEVAVRKAVENKGKYKQLLEPNIRRSLIIILGLSGTQQLCGCQAIITYSTQIFDKMNSGLVGSEASIVMGVVQLVTAVIATLIVDKINRRPILLFSMGGAAVSHTIVGLFFFLERMGVDTSGIGWLAMLAIMTCIISYTLGMATVAFAILGETFPKNLRGVAGATFTWFGAVCGFTVSKLFQVVSDHLGSDVTFWAFAVFSYAFLPFIWFLIPETRGKSLDVILELLKSGKMR